MHVVLIDRGATHCTMQKDRHSAMDGDAARVKRVEAHKERNGANGELLRHDLRPAVHIEERNQQHAIVMSFSLL